MTEQAKAEAVTFLVNTATEYIQRFSKEIRGLEGYCDSGYGGTSLTLGYCALQPTYTKEQAKKALALFKDYSNLVTLLVDSLKAVDPSIKIEYHLDKSRVSSSRIGREVFVELGEALGEGAPFILPQFNYFSDIRGNLEDWSGNLNIELPFEI